MNEANGPASPTALRAVSSSSLSRRMAAARALRQLDQAIDFVATARVDIEALTTIDHKALLISMHEAQDKLTVIAMQLSQ